MPDSQMPVTSGELTRLQASLVESLHQGLMSVREAVTAVGTQVIGVNLRLDKVNGRLDKSEDRLAVLERQVAVLQAEPDPPTPAPTAGAAGSADPAYVTTRDLRVAVIVLAAFEGLLRVLPAILRAAGVAVGN